MCKDDDGFRRRDERFEVYICCVTPLSVISLCQSNRCFDFLRRNKVRGWHSLTAGLNEEGVVAGYYTELFTEIVES